MTDTETIHEFFGFSIEGDTRKTLAEGQNECYSDFVKFAVYRDPVERFFSVYRDKVSPLRSSLKSTRKYFSKKGVIDADIETFLDFTRKELSKDDVLSQDEHLRRQSSFYMPADVDFIVPLEYLGPFLTEHLGISASSYFNRSTRTAAPKISEKLKIELEDLYREDYELLQAVNKFSPRLPG